MWNRKRFTKYFSLLVTTGALQILLLTKLRLFLLQCVNCFRAIWYLSANEKKMKAFLIVRHLINGIFHYLEWNLFYLKKKRKYVGHNLCELQGLNLSDRIKKIYILKDLFPPTAYFPATCTITWHPSKYHTESKAPKQLSHILALYRTRLRRLPLSIHCYHDRSYTLATWHRRTAHGLIFSINDFMG